jgi:hypothetical protein
LQGRLRFNRRRPTNEVLAMTRTSTTLLCLVIGAVPLGLACANDGADTRASTDTVDAAHSDLAKLRDDYRSQKQADLALLDRTIADVEAKEKSSSARARTDLHGMVVSLKAQRAAFARDLDAAGSASASTWDSTKAHLDAQWNVLEEAADRAVGATATALSAVYRPGEMTCEDFVALTDVEKPKVLYWGEGFNRSGQPVDSVVDVDQTDRLVPVLVSECANTPKALLSTAVQKHAAATGKPPAAALAPAKITCKQFVSLDDVVKPKLVYWDEGFSTPGDGGAPIAVVDIEATDRLVPQLVTECSAAPKLTLWQKIKQHI